MSSASVPSLYLDPQIRDWVLFPITLVMVRTFFIIAIPTLMCQCTLDTRRGVKTLCRRSFAVISVKAPTSSYPGAVRD